MQSWLHWAGHVVRMKDPCLPKKLFDGELSQGKRSQGGQKKRFKDTLKVSMKSFGVTLIAWNIWCGTDKWHKVVKRGAKIGETRRNAVIELHRKLRKGTSTSATAVTIPSSHWPRLFRAQIDLICALTDSFFNQTLIRWSSSITMDKELGFNHYQTLLPSKFVTKSNLSAELRIRLLYTQRKNKAPFKKNRCMTLSCIWWWGSSSGDLKTVLYSFTPITSGSTVARNGSTC